MQIVNYENLNSDLYSQFFKKIEFEAISSVEIIVNEVRTRGEIGRAHV